MSAVGKESGSASDPGGADDAPRPTSLLAQWRASADPAAVAPPHQVPADGTDDWADEDGADDTAPADPGSAAGEDPPHPVQPRPDAPPSWSGLTAAALLDAVDGSAPEAPEDADEPEDTEAPEDADEPDAGDRPTVQSQPAGPVEEDVPPGTVSRPVPFAARRGHADLAPIAILVAIGCAAIVGRMAIEDTVWDDVAYSVSLTVLAAALLVLAWRAGSSRRIVRIERDGMLRVVAGDTVTEADLTSRRNELEVHGRPGDPDWRVRVLRPTAAPMTIDAGMVDPRTFMEAVRQWRPDL